MDMRRNRRIRGVVTAVTGGALALSLLAATPASAALPRTTTPPAPGPCALVRSVGEAIQDFSIRIITCAADKWPVEGGADKAICIARRESGLIPTASSPTGMYVGLFQHSAADWPNRYEQWTRPSWQLKENPYNGRTNAIVTIRMANAQGWGAWAGVGC
ncbi:MAG: hypothetical protein ACXVEI_12925 [Actinomycetota bacterium]